MGKENSGPKFDPANPMNRVDAGNTQIGAGGAFVGGGATFDIGESGSTTAKAEDRRTIGPYLLVKKLGEGGMGQVWLAEQTAPVKRQVALKLIKGGWFDSAVIQRFESERQSLAMMNHPAIAKVFDAGTTKDGQPYFVMEYVDGLPITRYCDNKKLKIRERLELFIKVCEGVQHAHRKAIIHRDLKPSNVLVVEVDRKPVPRIIDFGLAKAISTQLGAEQTQFTQIGALIGTRGFMSPEQADPGILDVDTRTDVYSMGVILYVLLTGMLPFDAEEWKKRPLDESLRQLREVDPPIPSAKLSGKKDTARDSASNRAIEPRQLVGLLRGDLDWITARALERDRARRYGASSELAADIERYLQNRPVVAGPASKAYRLRKYVRRNRAAVALAGGLALLLAGFGIMQAAQLRRTSRERDRANRITDFMTSMFKVSNPSEARGNTITAREILDRSSKDIDTSLTKDPELQAQLTDVMGNVYTSLGLYEKGGSLLARAAETRRRILGPKNPDTLRSMGSLAWNLQRAGHHTEAEKLGRETLNAERKVLGPENRDTLKTESDLAWTLYEEGRYADAEELFRHTLEIQRRVFGQEDKETILSMSVLGWTLAEEGHYAEAEKMEREAVDSGRRALGSLDPTTLGAMNNLAGILFWQNRYSDADHLYRELIDLYRRGSGAEHPDTLLATKNLANLLDYQGRYQEAADLQRKTLEIQRRTLGPEHRDTLLTQRDLAGSLGGLGKYDEAEKLLYQTRDIQRRLMGPESPRTATTTYSLACLAVRRGRFDDAFSFLREAIEHGLSPAEDIGIESDPDLKSLHGDLRFAAVVAEGKQRASVVTNR